MRAYSKVCEHPYKIDKTGHIYKFLTLSQSLLNDIRINPGLYKKRFTGMQEDGIGYRYFNILPADIPLQ